MIKNREWHHSYTHGMTVEDLFDDIHHCYGLEDSITDRLCLSYYTHTRNGKRNVVRINENESNKFVLEGRTCVNKDGRKVNLQLKDLNLHVKIEKGEEVEKDETCDSSFMMDTIFEIGTSIRTSFKWVPEDVPIYLFMDNAGGHGTDQVKNEYVRILKSKFNIIVEWQVANSPETNLLDLGFWATVQSCVEKLHKFKRMDPDSLSRSVRDAWFGMDTMDKLDRIYKRWEHVLSLIEKGKGTNDLVESDRGLTKSLDSLPNLPVVVERIVVEEDDDDVGTASVPVAI
jgi:hypothetical protein